MLSAPLIIVLCSLHTAFATWSCVSCLSARCLHLVVNQPCQWTRADADEAAEPPQPSQRTTLTLTWRTRVGVPP